MKTIVYNVNTCLPAGEVLSGMSVLDEIEKNAIPNFGGTVEDYKAIELTEEEYEKIGEYTFTIVDGKIVFGDKKPTEPELPKPPSPTDVLAQGMIELKLSNMQLRNELESLRSQVTPKPSSEE